MSFDKQKVLMLMKSSLSIKVIVIGAFGVLRRLCSLGSGKHIVLYFLPRVCSVNFYLSVYVLSQINIYVTRNDLRLIFTYEYLVVTAPFVERFFFADFH